ncbi:FACL123Cp [Eremothecium gossypii FDAG1]|nr:FACL123Cp [Eremothecium gossypii FDAG1]
MSEAFHFLAEFIDSVLPDALARRQGREPAFVLISGPQGSGKTFNAAQLLAHVAQQHRAVGLSIDDFYLPAGAQAAVAAGGNPLLAGRGLPGTHDVPLLRDTLARLRTGEGEVELPQYDKAAHGGRGDRCAARVRVQLPVDVVILEGWFLGFEPAAEAELARAAGTYGAAALREVNAALEDYSACLWRAAGVPSVGIVFDAQVRECVARWRIQQEHELRERRGAGMTDAQVHAFLERYLVCYDVYYARLVREGLGNLHRLTVGLDGDRKVTYVSQKNM